MVSVSLQSGHGGLFWEPLDKSVGGNAYTIEWIDKPAGESNAQYLKQAWAAKKGGWTCCDTLCGAMPGKSTHDIHHFLFGDLADASEGREGLVGYKADLCKFFDSVAPGQAVDTAVYLGLPDQLAGLLKSFYASQERFLSVDGDYDASPLRPLRGFLQGCPGLDGRGDPVWRC